MSTILNIYSSNSFRRFLLPPINDANYSVLLSKSMFQLEENVELKLENINHEWFFWPTDEYQILEKNKASCFGKSLRNVEIARIILDGKNSLVLLVEETDNYFTVYQKYDIRSIKGSVTIGFDVKNSIVYSNLSLVSGRHARIKIDGLMSAVFEDLDSVNGSFVNYRRVEGSIPLDFGDCIDIYGLRIVYLGSFLAVNQLESGAKVNPQHLKAVTINAPRLDNPPQKKKKEMFHRSPRHIPKIHTEEISIEEAPQPQKLDQPSMLMTIVPALTMSLPMLLGGLLMIWARRQMGSQSAIYQYVGLVTSISSAIIGVTWAIVRQRSAVKKYEQEKNERNVKYREYVTKKEQQIREEYNHNAEALYERYLSADECCDFNISNSALWNRNVRQSDFLCHRIGIGDIPFQAKIKVPEEKFTMLEDDLMELPEKIKQTYCTLHNVPVCIDFLEEKLVGIVGGRNLEGAVNVAQCLIAQIAANNAYTDVKLVIIYDEKKCGLDGEWNFAKWLPHVWNETGTFRYVASNKEEASEVFFELAKTFRQRIENSSSSGFGNSSTTIVRPYYIMVMANPEALEGELISKYVFEQDPIYGLSTFFLAENYEDLPNECELIIQNDEQFGGMYRVTDDLDDRSPITFDAIAPVLLDRLAGNLADIEIHEVETGGDVPNSLTFFDMYGIGSLSELNVLERWRKNRNYETMKALVGQKAGGVDCYLDVHEKYHGPHGLVAGTTGSGKSETLQTYILSLCVNFSPNDVALFIIDYKGGGMGNLFTKLPHMIGQISNLSGNQIQRALLSIKSEKDRRQRIFNEYSVNNINSYTKLYKNNETKIPVPHLFIIIDEFAEMKRDEPAFIQELVSVSQVGRSLGIHLIMATQKPAGTVDDNIWSNSKFKLCLRVQDKQDSMDMLHRADAAYITQAGRCYLQVGNDELFELFQSGWSGAAYSEETDDQQADIAKILTVDGVPALEGSRTKTMNRKERRKRWITSLLQVLANVLKEKETTLENCYRTSEGRNHFMDQLFQNFSKHKIEFPKSEGNINTLKNLLDMVLSEGMNVDAIIQKAEQMNRRLPEKTEKTQLDAVVEYLADLAVKKGFLYDFQLFLPLLPEKLYLTELPKTTLPFDETTTFNGTKWPEIEGDWTLAVSMGLFDDPENQRQDTYVLDIASAGNTALIGVLATGKSTFLQTFLYGLVARYTPAEVNLYILDFSAKMLLPFETAPHVGGVMGEEDLEKISKFFAFISRVLEKRKKLLKGGSFEQYLGVNGRGALPAIIIVIDNYSGFQQKAGLTEQNVDFLRQLAKEGVSYGIFLIVTAGGFGREELPTRMEENFRTTICLELNDRFDYSRILRRTVRRYPESDVKGRGIAIIEDRILEFQTALGVEAESDYARSELLKEKMQAMADVWTGQAAATIPEIPEKPVWSEFVNLSDVQEMLQSDRFLPLGYEAKYADVFGVDLSRILAYQISGAKRKGKTNALKALILSAGAKGGKVIVIDYESTLTKVCQQTQAEQITTEEQFYQFLAGFLPEFEKRNKYKHQLLEQGLEEEEIYDQMQQFEKIFFFVDDLPKFIETTYGKKSNPKVVGDYHGLLEQMIDYGALHNYFWFICVNKKEMGGADTRKLYKLLIRDKKGIHLGGETNGSTMNFDYIPYRQRDKSMPAGRGYLAADNEDNCQEVVVPLVKGSVV